jgi:hypothetical protein
MYHYTVQIDHSPIHLLGDLVEPIKLINNDEGSSGKGIIGSRKAGRKDKTLKDNSDNSMLQSTNKWQWRTVVVAAVKVVAKAEPLRWQKLWRQQQQKQ